MKNSFKTIGIIGGMGSLATAALFQKVLEHSGALRDAEYPRVFIDNNTTIPDRTDALIGRGPSPAPALVRSASGLVSFGAQILGMPCNTAHAFLPDIRSVVDVPFIDMVEETASMIASEYAATRVGVLCTSGTRASGLYDVALAARGLTTINVDDLQQDLVMRAIYGAGGIKSGYTTMPREILTRACASLNEQGAEIIVLACTELPLALSQSSSHVPLVDTTDVLAKALIREARILI